MEIFNETSEKKVITKCEKKISKNIDLESSLTLSYRNIEIKLKTSLTKNLENNFIIYTDKDVITLRNIFNISCFNPVLEIFKTISSIYYRWPCYT